MLYIFLKYLEVKSSEALVQSLLGTLHFYVKSSKAQAFCGDDLSLMCLTQAQWLNRH